MSKKDIGKTLSAGATKQRLQLYFEDTARHTYGLERLLTDNEALQLSKTFKTPSEIKLWNKWIQIDRKITISLLNLQGAKFEVLMNYSNLRGYILVWETMQNAEVLSNLILHEIKEDKLREKIASESSKLSNFLFTDILVDKEGYLDINIDFERDTYTDEKGNFSRNKNKTKKFSLWYVMNNVKKEATTSVVKFIAWREAILDYMDEEGFNIKTYKDLIFKMTEDIHKPIIGWTKYESSTDSFLGGIKLNRIDKLKSKFNITPNISELETEEKIDREIYNYYKTEFLQND